MRNHYISCWEQSKTGIGKQASTKYNWGKDPKERTTANKIVTSTLCISYWKQSKMHSLLEFKEASCQRLTYERRRSFNKYTMGGLGLGLRLGLVLIGKRKRVQKLRVRLISHNWSSQPVQIGLERRIKIVRVVKTREPQKKETRYLNSFITQMYFIQIPYRHTCMLSFKITNNSRI